MNTEITKIRDIQDLRGWVLYDAECPRCCTWAKRWEAALTRRGFDIAPLQSPWLAECLDMKVANPPAEMLVLTPAGQVYGGADALIFIAQTIWWAVPFAWCAKAPGVRPLLRQCYAWVAAHRKCGSGYCSVTASKRAAPVHR
ncbi:MAG TPA: DCC1-like thiol-disulfide oxidoreductase family protein [Verrucomicrobiae bacterium]